MYDYELISKYRLKYLLSQSDIFTHFGVGGKKPEDPVKAAKESSSSSSTTGAAATGGSRHRQSVATGKGKSDLDDLDDDEKDIVRAEEEEEETATKPHGVFLTKQPSLITGGTMRQYQLEGLNWVARLIDNGINGILADEMGLGKTLQSISVLAYMKEYLNISGPHLVMVPKSTLSNWMNEFRNWCPSIRTLKFHGNKEERQAIIDDMMRPSATQDQREWDVLITTYEIVNLERNALTKIAWRYLIIDEAHRLKNEASQFSMVCNANTNIVD